MNEAELLASGCEEMGLSLSAETQQQLLQYLALLNKWNKVYNLTAIRTSREMVVLHILDSLSVLPYVTESTILDVGSGAGLPGIVLAIANPNLKVSTIDTVQKKAIFMRQAKAELGLNNLDVLHNRVETIQPETLYQQVISRAFSSLELFIKLTQHVIAKPGTWLAMKGTVPQQEIATINMAVKNIIPLKVAKLEAERHLILFENIK